MRLDSQQFKIRGMQRDTTESSFSGDFAFENMNMSILSRDSNTLLSLSTERGNRQIQLYKYNVINNNYLPTNIEGTVLGYAVLSDILILFSHSNTNDFIYKIIKNTDGDYIMSILFQGNLNLDTEHPVDTLAFYENEDIKKIYWTDSKNQPRVINIELDKSYVDSSFDFIQPLELKETISITKNDLSSGIFPAGTVQYAFTYYNQYEQETNIFKVSPLFYSSFRERGGTAEEKISNSFLIKVKNVDSKFDYMRIYSIIRTSIDATPTVKRITDISIKAAKTIADTEFVFTDANTTGDIITPTDLLYIGGEELIADTISQKDNTLFLGGLQIVRPTLQNIVLTDRTITYSQKQLYYERSGSSYYNYKPETLENKLYLNENVIEGYNSTKTFKYKETYRFGLQAQHKSGKWSETIWINDVENTIKAETTRYLDGVIVNGSKASYSIPSTVINNLISKGYKKVRGVVVYPQLNDRSVVAQGVLNPTVYNVTDRFNNTVDNIASWFIRPTINGTVYQDSIAYNGGTTNEFRHNRCVPGWGDVGNTVTSSVGCANGEIQAYGGYPVINHLGSAEALDFVNDYGSNFYIDQSILTLNSPEIEFDDTVQNMSSADLKLRIIGLVNLTSYNSTMSVSTSTGAKWQDNGGFNLRDNAVLNYSSLGYRSMNSVPSWVDRVVLAENNDKPLDQTEVTYMIYPWHGSRSLNNDINAPSRTAMLEYKKLSNLRYSGYNTNVTNWSPNHGITDVGIFNQTEDGIIKITSPDNESQKIIYKANIDKIITAGKADVLARGGYPIVVVPNGYSTPVTLDNSMNTGGGGAWSSSELPHNYRVGTEPVRIQYKSAPHAVFGLKWAANNTQLISPCINNTNRIDPGDTFKTFYRTTDYNVNQDTITVNNYGESGLWLAELYRDVDTTTRFGGQTIEALENNSWLPCGESVSLYEENGDVKTTATILYTDGDTFVQRYDCLKTYPYGESTVNSVAEVVSFLCETHINLDGRTDRNRGNLDNRVASPLNFNLMNEVYNQKDNFFNYRALNYDRFNLNNFPNTITWTKNKVAGELIDTWTNVTMANTLDLDGLYGKVSAIKKFNNELVTFQDSAIATLLYNNRVQVNASDGIPIEIANSARVDGKRYISTNVGTRNKWSITESPYGLYFSDAITKGLYLFDGKINNISTELGFHSWTTANMSNQGNWNPATYSNFTTQYDRINNNVYFINKNSCLGYSELIKQFVSFYDYNETSFMFNAFDTFISIRKPFPTVIPDNTTYLWEQNQGNYGEYFGTKKPFWTTIIANKEPDKTKVFNTLSVRADAFTLNGVISEQQPFDKLDVYNEYQNGSSVLAEYYSRPSTLKQKFRVWRMNIPRDNSDRTSGNRAANPYRRFGVDRMRNPWLYIKLIGSGQLGYKTVLHDIVVNYTI